MRIAHRFGSASIIAAATAVFLAGASTLFAQAIAPRRVTTTPPPSATMPPSICVPESANTGTPCSLPITPVPTLSPTPLPVPKPLAPPTVPSPRSALAGGAAKGGAAVGLEKVLSYFQRNVTRVDTRKAFGFVLLPKSAVTAQEKQIQMQFCRIMLASMDFVDADDAARTDALVTYWPLIATPTGAEIKAAFASQDCARLLAWYDHRLARQVAVRADVAGLSGPFLITWPSQAAGGALHERDPLIVDFAVADYERATKALTYWFGQLRTSPELWTSRIREGTIRAELADAINDTAGVMVAVLAGKWESVTAVNGTP